jgi:hypothetical protein
VTVKDYLGGSRGKVDSECEPGAGFRRLTMMDVGQSDWDVFEVFDLDNSTKLQLVRLGDHVRLVALSDLMGFFELLLVMLVNPDEAARRFGGEVVGLDELQSFLNGDCAALAIAWNCSRFKASRNEFGAVIISSLRMRKPPRKKAA